MGHSTTTSMGLTVPTTAWDSRSLSNRLGLSVLETAQCGTPTVPATMWDSVLASAWQSHSTNNRMGLPVSATEWDSVLETA